MTGCTNDYIIEFNDQPELQTDELWIAGGMYGNIYAIEKLNEVALGKTIVYNGDLHWFDASKESFDKVEELSKDSIKLNGNVEVELKRVENLGCGCNYPSYEQEVIVKNAELIHARLKSIGSDFSIFEDRKTTMHVNVAGVKVAITHGDEKSLNGWGFDHEVLKTKTRQDEIFNWFQKTKFDIIATSHTCKAAVLNFSNKVILNNGSAGMPNFSEFVSGLVTRIASTPNEKALFRSKIGDVFAELILLKYNKKEFLRYFEELWSEDSAASISYKARILGYGCPLSYKDINFGGFKEA
ncbi:calcineurin phosphoesterase [Campylobacter sp. RM16192]|uniref:calcineurin phosphoesterase n=1 Tax=Campylobacter sp. RM16192 TaxID=1660080 RepID=UPI0014526470|nr:calcineurin phosphoesterase [Campylobacter sp. RM16192]QCD53148.1 hypothetical protein CDOMC_1552 [Campylobacter sp. RM16192]